MINLHLDIIQSINSIQCLFTPQKPNRLILFVISRFDLKINGSK